MWVAVVLVAAIGLTSTLGHPSSEVGAPNCESECGMSIGLPINPHREERAADSSGQADYMEFPWMVWIANPSLTTRCGGSLIHPQVVLTGAHCVNGKKELVVRAGEWNIQTQDKKELFPHQELKVKEVVVHDKFNKGSLAYGIALLILDSPVNTTGNVGLVHLSAQGEFDDKHCLMSGWGGQLNSKEDQTILKRVGPLPFVPREKCQEALRKTKLKEQFRLHETFICAAGGTSATSYTCKGDGGGPLVCPLHESSVIYVQAGILAWGISCGPDTPAVYVNVRLFVPWIYDQLKAKGIKSFHTLEYELDENPHLAIDIRLI